MASIFTKDYWKTGVKNLQDQIGLPALTSNTITLFNDFMGFLMGRISLKKYIKAYGRNPFVSMIINKIAFQSGSIKRIAEDLNGNPIENSKILDLLSAPNADQNQIEFLEEAAQYYSSTGNAYIWHIKGVGAGDELKILESEKIEIKCDKFGDVITYNWTKPNGMVQKIPAEEVVHVHESNIVFTDNTDAKYGLSKLHAAMIVIVSSDEKFKAEASIFKNKGAAGILTSDTDKPMLPMEKEKMQKELDDEIAGAENYNKVKVSATKLRFLQMGMSPTDLKLLEGLLSSLRILCSTFGLSSVIFNDTANSTYNNVTEAHKNAYTDVYIPIANKFDDKISKFLAKRLNVKEVIKVDLASIEVIKLSTNEVAQALSTLSPLLANKITEAMTEDELRDVVRLGALQEGQTPIGRTVAEPTINVEG